MKLQTRTIKASKIKTIEVVAGVLYGTGFEAVSVKTSLQEFIKAYSNFGTSKTFEVILEGEKHIVYFKEIVPDYLKAGVYKHFDLIKVSKDDTLTSKVRVIFLNKDDVKKQGLIINTVMDDIEIEYLVGAGVSNVELDLAGMTENDVKHVSDIIPIEGVKFLDDPSQSVVTVSFPREEVEEDPDADEQDEIVVETEE